MSPKTTAYQGNRQGTAMLPRHNSIHQAASQTQGPTIPQDDPFANTYFSYGGYPRGSTSYPDPVHNAYSSVPDTKLQDAGNLGDLDTDTQFDPMVTSHPGAFPGPPKPLNQSSMVANSGSAIYHSSFDNSIPQLDDPDYRSISFDPEKKPLTKSEQKKLEKSLNPTRNKDGSIRKPRKPTNPRKSSPRDAIKLETVDNAEGSENNLGLERSVALAPISKAADNREVQEKPKSNSIKKKRRPPVGPLTEEQRKLRNATRVAQLHRQKARRRAEREEAKRLAGASGASTLPGSEQQGGIQAVREKHQEVLDPFGHDFATKTSADGTYTAYRRAPTRRYSVKMFGDAPPSLEDFPRDEGFFRNKYDPFDDLPDDGVYATGNRVKAPIPESSQSPDRASPDTNIQSSVDASGNLFSVQSWEEGSEASYDQVVWTNPNNTPAPNYLTLPPVSQNMDLGIGEAPGTNLSSGVPGNSWPSTDSSVPAFDCRRVVMCSRGGRSGRSRYEMDDHGHVWFFDMHDERNPILVFDGSTGANDPGAVPRHQYGLDLMMTSFCCYCGGPMGNWEQGDACVGCMESSDHGQT